MIAGLTVSLGRLGKGQKAEVVGLDETGIASTLRAGELERRLIEMGLVEGAHLEILHEGFPGRDPIAVRVDDHTVALRRAEAEAVLVRLPEGAG
jgi:ferrous iron transport protein A